MALSIDLNALLDPSLYGDGNWLNYIGVGALWTVGLAVSSFALAVVVGTIMGTMRTLPIRCLRLISEAWIEFFRNIPLIVQMFIWYYVVPEIVPFYKTWVVNSDPIVTQFFSAFLCLGLFTSSRVAEQVRAGIEAIPKGLPKAATALGLTTVQRYRFVLLPMAYRLVLPPLTSEAMNMIKNTAVAMTIGLPEITLRANEMGENTFQFFAAYLWASVLYIVISLAVSRIMRCLEARSRIPGFVTNA